MTVKFKPDAIRNAIAELKSARVQSEIGETVISEMKKSLKVGVSPVKGERRLEPYVNPKSYPGKLKPRSPVNLELSGDMLDALDYKVSDGRVTVGIFDGKEAVKARAHNDGEGNMPRRHFMPTDKGDELNVTISQKVRDLFAKIMNRK